MSRSGLIDAYLAQMASRLPAPIIAELADGLHDTYDAHRARGLGSEQAERAAVTEFGDLATVVAAFVAASTARRAARFLLVTGPVVGATWAAVLLARHGWDWPLGLATRIGLGTAVLTAVALLAAAAFQTRYRAAARSTAAACLLVLAVDAGMLGYIVTTGQLASWPVPVAATLSAVRVGFTLTRLPRVLLVA
ncbi:permease prefix domain 1-containing protein [Jatrophihabitans cynanchi]|uniref:Permease prefix domain 1-containing protein n=1 Tax=Jatrophihabitans cynanchi TaxID=2944128 RepID=A0ABY7K167_9ACTN|nr:permease prefix domain 1-containing protein [Jatrophihabitans sp. SB3-54]WAX58414.1 permease prefix domain 1-containing protein [Jatrophihabitans sp. SB3-54]